MLSIEPNHVKKPINALIVDDHPLIRKAVSNLLKSNPLVKSCEQAENGKIALERFKEKKFDIVFLDIAMPVMDGITTLHHLKHNYPFAKVVILTMFENNRQFIELIELGVSGYLLKTIDDEELNKAIDLILEGRQYFTPIVYNFWIEYISENKDSNSVYHKSNILSTRELEVLQGICMQLNAKEIGEKYFISENTVNNHRSHIMKKTGIHNTVGLVVYAIKNGIFVP